MAPTRSLQGALSRFPICPLREPDDCRQRPPREQCGDVSQLGRTTLVGLQPPSGNRQEVEPPDSMCVIVSVGAGVPSARPTTNK